MREWFKFNLDETKSGTEKKPIDSSFADHAKGMLGYYKDPAYKSKDAFFEKFIENPDFPNWKHYEEFISSRVSTTDKILSVASGRSANEVKLLDSGHDITCSDLDKPECFDDTVGLFPSYKFKKIDILSGPTTDSYDVIISLGLIFLFDNENLSLFLKNVFDSLKPGGRLLLDSAGSSDKLMANFIHDQLLKYETLAKRAYLGVRTGKKPGYIIKHHGYRRTSAELLKLARREGFRLKDQVDYNFLVEFRRSKILYRLINPTSWTGKLFSKLGRSIPYNRMFELYKL
ncbi:MAG: hypothetical protein JKX97_00600 [Candidatus Lindowbacteria bacterium]|nr:hypothetical protein [Candidatus Lindowbacteria bacterium]